ncbi:MAG TPA: enolase C-terminal domain-like protein, partial [Acidimicrobiales bacterium]|nr:enolase C-terminal domain-like protein [Acidimicrobiales bacterium]
MTDSTEDGFEELTDTAKDRRQSPRLGDRLAVGAGAPAPYAPERALDAGAPKVARRHGAISSPISTKIDRVSCEAFRVPTDGPEADGTVTWDATTLVVVRAAAGDVTGLGWTYSSEASAVVVRRELAGVVEGGDVFDVPRHHEAMVRHCRNFGQPGVVASAISALDIALWDLKARLLGLPLSELFGRCRDEVPIYGSGGFTTYDDPTTAAQMAAWVHSIGISMVKMKIGESWGENIGRDLERVALARRVVGDDVELMADANGAYSRKQAVRVGRQLADEYGVTWLEEPVSSDDLGGLHMVRDALACDVAAGEYGYDEKYFARMAAADAVDCLQADVTRCGGYTSWLR